MMRPRNPRRIPRIVDVRVMVVGDDVHGASSGCRGFEEADGGGEPDHAGTEDEEGALVERWGGGHLC